MTAKRMIKTSVRNLVEFVLRSGDLTAAFTGSSRLQEGSRIHRRLQQSQGAGYEAEVSLTIIVELADVCMQISGRADGVITAADEAGGPAVTIDEIKSTTADLADIEEDTNPLHWAQAKCYAVEHKLSRLGVQLCYCQADTLVTKTFKKIYSAAELAGFFTGLLSQYALWAERLGAWTETRDSSAQLVEFPFGSFRQGQRQLAVAVYQTLTKGGKLFAQAPTGTGKTMATLFPAIKAMGLGYVDKIFFLTAKTVTRQLAEEAFARLRRTGLRCKTLTLTAKEKICFQPEAACTPEECAYAKGYYDRINPALSDCWQLEAYTRDVVEAYARRHTVCPFELSLDLALWADAVICDYNYVFDPRVYLKRFFAENNGHYSFLVDEAHNLVDRARDMFSAELNKQAFLDIKQAVKTELPKLAKAAGKINTLLGKAGKLCAEPAAGQPGYCVRQEPLSDLNPLLRKFAELAEKWLAENKPAAFRDDLLTVYFQINAFLRTGEMYDKRYVTYLQKVDKDVKLKLFCVNPAELLRQALERGKATVFFSATLTPLAYFTEVLGGGAADGQLVVASPFDPANLALLVADTISTTYKLREKTYDRVVDSIGAAVTARAGNYLVFLPSYRYLEEVYQRFCRLNLPLRIIRQQGDMDETQRADFLGQFAGDNRDTLVGFAVLGGVFGEGIDLTGERLVGAVIVGVGLPMVCLEREIIKTWFDADNELGFEYAYVYPGMNKVLQAAGRVIRTEQDRGLVLLIDERFSQTRYRRLFPKEWRGASKVKDTGTIAAKAQRFWQGPVKNC